MTLEALEHAMDVAMAEDSLQECAGLCNIAIQDFPSFLSLLEESEHYEAEERAAIHEFDGGLSRVEAERRTMRDYENVD